VKLLLLAALLAAGAQAAGYRIAGVVVNAATNQPLGGVRVTIAPVERREERLPFITGQDGRFIFAGVPQGRYELMAQRRGYLTQIFARAIVAGPGQHSDTIVLPLSPPGVIAGKVMDDAGEPVDQAVVQLFSSTIVNGRRRLTSFSTKQTADNGEYRFSGLAAGTYYVAASGYPWYTKLNQTHADPAARGMTHTGYGIQFFRNTGDPTSAEPLTLKPGQEAAADFALLPLPAVSVHVHAEGYDDLNKQYTLSAAGLAGNQVLARQGGAAGDLYNFWGVPPGHYTLQVQAATSRHSFYAREPVDVGASDTDVRVTLVEAPSLTGTVELDSGSLPANLSVELFDLETGSSEKAPVAGGTFTIAGIPREQYRVALTGADEYYLKRWSAEGTGSAVHLRLIAAKGAGRVMGTVQRDGVAFPGALVVLAPAADPANPEDYRAVESDSDGSYELRGVPPGAYALFAVEDGADLEYANPAAIRPYLATAKTIQVPPSGSITQRLDLPGATANRPASASPAP
jgi:type IV secretory pathway protease TraF